MSGTFTTMNKKRPGAYIRFKGANKASMGVGSRGIVTIPLALSWGAENKIIELTGSDITDGKCLAKLGYEGKALEIQMVREVLKNATQALIYRVDTGGIKATATLDNMTVVALYPGVVGNRLSIVIKVKETKFEVLTCLEHDVVNRQLVANTSELKNNEFVTFTVNEEMELLENAGVSLTGGTDGTVSDNNYKTYFEKIKNMKWNTMGFVTKTAKASESQQIAIAFIKNLRDKGKKVQIVTMNCADSNHEGVISVSQGYRTKDESVSVESFVGYVAGLTAGANINQSNTYSTIAEAVEIINPKTDDEIEAGIDNGEFMLSYRQDGAIVVETDINTFHTFLPDKSRDFSKNRVIRVLDELNNTIQETFEKAYIGKIDNNEAGRTSFKADLVSYCMKLQEMNAIQNFKAEDITITEGNGIDSVIADVAIQPVDSMEKLYMTVMVG